MTAPTRYAMGFMLSQDSTRIALVTKNRPTRLVGLLTGPGGHWEPGETAQQCVAREFLEETGVATQPEDWTHFATVDNPTMHMPCFVMRDDRVNEVRSMEDELVSVYDICDLEAPRLAPHARDLIVLALVFSPGHSEFSTLS